MSRRNSGDARQSVFNTLSAILIRYLDLERKRAEEQSARFISEGSVIGDAKLKCDSKKQSRYVPHDLEYTGTCVPVGRKYFRFSLTIVIHSRTLRSLVNLSPRTDVDFRWKVFMISPLFLLLNYIVNSRSIELHILYFLKRNESFILGRNLNFFVLNYNFIEVSK